MTSIERLIPCPRPRFRLAVAGLACALGACKTTPAPAPVAPPPFVVTAPPACPVVPLVQDPAARHIAATQERLAALDTAGLALEANRKTEGGAPDAALDQALALSLTHAPGDLARAQALVDTVVHAPGPDADPWHVVARLLAVRLAEQRRAEDASDRLALQLHDQQRDNQRKLDQLNEKLEALKAIERNLNARPAPKPATSP